MKTLLLIFINAFIFIGGFFLFFGHDLMRALICFVISIMGQLKYLYILLDERL